MEPELRRSPRIPFIATAEITEVDSEVRLTARTGDLSQGGCYLDMVNPLPQGHRREGSNRAWQSYLRRDRESRLL